MPEVLRWQGEGMKGKGEPGPEGGKGLPLEDREELTSSGILPVSVLKGNEFSHQVKCSRLGPSYGPVTGYLG